MNEYTFAKTCIKVAGLIILILGLTGLAMNTLTTAIYWTQGRRALQQAKEPTSISIAVGLQRATANAASRIPGNIVQILVGLYLCRRYQKPLRWLMKDEPTIS